MGTYWSIQKYDIIEKYPMQVFVVSKDTALQDFVVSNDTAMGYVMSRLICVLFSFYSLCICIIF